MCKTHAKTRDEYLNRHFAVLLISNYNEVEKEVKLTQLSCIFSPPTESLAKAKHFSGVWCGAFLKAVYFSVHAQFTPQLEPDPALGHRTNTDFKRS